jgi:hypothetical protein
MIIKQLKKTNRMKREYIVSSHGLLWIVFCVDSDYMGDHSTEDSRWEDKTKAETHCRLLNFQLEVQRQKQLKNKEQ